MKNHLLIFCFLMSLCSMAQNNSSSINMNINMNFESNEQNTAQPSQNSNMNISIEESYQEQAAPVEQAAPTQNESKPEPVYVAGYSGKVGCTPPTSSERLEGMAKTVENQSFGDDKVRVTKQILRTNCITLDQLIIILNKFDWDDGKLEIAKFAYDYVYDLENYYKVYDLFSFSSSGEELEEFLNSRR